MSSKLPTKKCKYCNERIEITANECPYCGEKQSISLSQLGFIFSWFGIITIGISSVVGLVLSCIGLYNSRKKGEKDEYAILGIVVSSIPLLFLMILMEFSVINTLGITESNNKIEYKKVTDFSKLNRDEAKSWCNKNQVNCNFSYEYSDTISKDKLIKQNPDKDILIEPYGIIYLVYSNGKKEKKEEIEEEKPEEKETVAQIPERFTMLEHYVSDESNDFAMYIEGRIQYNRDTDLKYIQVTFTTYDAAGNTIGTCLANNSGLNAHGIWKFKAICLDGNQIDHYELKEISGL